MATLNNTESLNHPLFAVEPILNQVRNVLDLLDSICAEGKDAFEENYNQFHGGVSTALYLLEMSEKEFGAAHASRQAISQAQTNQAPFQQKPGAPHP